MQPIRSLLHGGATHLILFPPFAERMAWTPPQSNNSQAATDPHKNLQPGTSLLFLFFFRFASRNP